MKEREIFSSHLFGTKAGVQFPSAEFYTEKDGTLIDGQLVHLPQESGHENEIAAFHEAIVKGLPSPVPAEESLEVIKILDGIYRSHKSGKEIKLA
jgi:predicted dehydrogenase